MSGKGQQREGAAPLSVLIDRQPVPRRRRRGRATSLQQRARAAGEPRDSVAMTTPRSRPTQPISSPSRRQPLVGIVGAQRQAIFGARGEHAIGLADAPRDEIVDHHAEIGFGAIEEDRRAAPPARARGVEPGDQSLRRRLLIAGRAIDLAGEEKSVENAWSRGSPPSSRGSTIIIFDRIAGPQNARLLQPRNAADEGLLHLVAAARSRCRSDRRCRRRAPPAPEKSDARRGRRSASPYPRSRGNSAGPGPEIAPLRIGERCEIIENDPMRRRRRAGDVAVDLRIGDRRRQIGEGLGRLVAPSAVRDAPSAIVRPSSRGGVPVFSRRDRKAGVRAIARRGRSTACSPMRPAGMRVVADMDHAVREMCRSSTTTDAAR